MSSTKETSDQPYFGFNVTYQGHGPYDTDVLWWGDGWVVDDGSTPGGTEPDEQLLRLPQGHGDHLKTFFDYYRASDQPVVIVLFGGPQPLDEGTATAFTTCWALIWISPPRRAF